MGTKLINFVVENTGLPAEPVHRELNGLLEKHGVNPDSMTLEDLREVLADYLQDVFLELQEKENRPSAGEAV